MSEVYPSVNALKSKEYSMQKRLTIRAGRPADKNRLVEIWLASVRATHTFLSEQAIQELLPLVREKALPALELWVLVSGEKIIGFAGLSDNNLEALFLHPEHLGKGGGKLLVKHARKLKGNLVVDVNEQNPNAVRFYESVGFEVFGRSETDSGGRPYPILHMRESPYALCF
jgi:putative acetyltransferase